MVERSGTAAPPPFGNDWDPEAEGLGAGYPSPPDIPYVVQLVENTRIRYRDMWERFDRIDRFRRQQNVINIPEHFKTRTSPVHTPFIPDVLRRAKAIIAGNLPTIHELTIGPTDNEQRATTRMEKFLNGLIYRMICENIEPVWDNINDDALTYGLSWHACVYDPSLWPEEPFRRRNGEKDREYNRRTKREKRSLPVPIIWRSCDPRSIVDVWDERGLKELVEYGDREVYDIHQRYDADIGILTGEAVDYARMHPPEPSPYADYEAQQVQSSLSPMVPPYATGATSVLVGQFVRVYKYTSKWWHIICTDRIVLLCEPRQGRRVPYFRFYGLSTSSRRPGYAPLSIVEELIPAVEMLEDLLTMKRAWAGQTAYPSGYVHDTLGQTLLVDEEGNALKEYTLDPGVMKLTGSAEPKWLSPPGTGGDLNDLIRIQLDLINTHSGIVPVLKGFGAADQAGYAISQLLSAAHQIFDPVRTHAEQTIVELAREILDIVRYDIKTDVVVWSGDGEEVSMGPKEIEDHYRPIEANIEFVLPSSLIAMGQAGLEQVKAGAYSMRYHREENLKIAYPDDMDTEVLFDELKNDPDIKQAIKAKLFLDQGMAQVVARYKALMEQAAAAALGETSAPRQMGTPVGGPNMSAMMPPGMPQPPAVPAGMGEPPPSAGPTGAPPTPASQAAGGLPGGRAAGVGIQPAFPNGAVGAQPPGGLP